MDLYTLEGDGVSLRRETFPQEICTVSRTNHGGHTGYKNKISLLHRAHRRGQFMLWTGDLARAAFALSRPAADIAPPPLMVGQLRIFADGVCAETVPTETVFSPEGAKWVCRFADKTLEIVSAIVSESEACVRVRVRGNDGGAKDAELTCTFGGPLLCSRPYDAGWLGLEPKPYPCTLKEEKGAFALAEKDGKEFCRFRFYTAEKAQYAAEGEICFTEQINGAAELREHRFFRPPVHVLRAECVMESGGEVLLRQTQLLPVLPVDRFAEEQFDARSVLLDIDGYLDSPFMSAKSAWRNMDDYPIMPLPYAEKGVLRTGAGKFRVKASPKAGEHCVCCAVAERGFLHEELQIPEPAAHESKLAFPVGRKVRNVGILFANELMARLCSAEAARLTFRYNEGEESFVLRGGKQLGGMFNNFAEETFAKVDLDGMQNSDFAAVLWYPADGTRILEEVCIEVLLHDCQIAVLGISLMV